MYLEALNKARKSFLNNLNHYTNSTLVFQAGAFLGAKN